MRRIILFLTLFGVCLLFMSACEDMLEPVAVDPYADSDGDGVVNWIEDLNRDGDYTNDDWDLDGIQNYKDADDDGDGTDTATELGDPSKPDDSDRDGIPDYLETSADPDGDGVPNYRDDDDDGDFVPTKNEFDGFVIGNFPVPGEWLLDEDTDCDGTINAYDADDDNDGADTKDEGGPNLTPDPLTYDDNENLRPDFLEADQCPDVKE